mmetsp:Transcript_30527/g.87192  ORF Transcript_30527/g.87192 Transcript_30527/m.87192 type:complete len:272 (+) Transcript_30527:1793-2608(+)
MPKNTIWAMSVAMMRMTITTESHFESNGEPMNNAASHKDSPSLRDTSCDNAALSNAASDAPSASGPPGSPSSGNATSTGTLTSQTSFAGSASRSASRSASPSPTFGPLRASASSMRRCNSSRRSWTPLPPDFRSEVATSCSTRSEEACWATCDDKRSTSASRLSIRASRSLLAAFDSFDASRAMGSGAASAVLRASTSATRFSTCRRCALISVKRCKHNFMAWRSAVRDSVPTRSTSAVSCLAMGPEPCMTPLKGKVGIAGAFDAAAGAPA